MDMNNYEIVSKSTKTVASYAKGEYKLEIDFSQDKEEQVENINITARKGVVYVGNVSAYRSQDGTLHTSSSDIPMADLAEVMGIIGEVYKQIVGDDGGATDDSIDGEETSEETDSEAKSETKQEED